MSEDCGSDVEEIVDQENVCHYGGDHSHQSKRRKKHSSKKKAKRRNFSGSINLTNLVSDSDSDNTALVQEIPVSEKEISNSNKKLSCVKDTLTNSNLENCITESTSYEKKVESKNISNLHIENEATIILNQIREKNNDEDLEKYVGNISEIDFSEMEMDIEVNQEPLITTESQKVVPKSTEKEKSDSKKSFCDSNKLCPKHFDVDVDHSSKSSQNMKTLTKKVEVQDKNDAMCAGLHNKSLIKNVGFVNNSTLTKSMSQIKFSPNISVKDKSLLKPNLPTTIDANGNKVFRFFWWDAYEAYKPPGVVYLFGKVSIEKTNDFKSCCVAVRNIPRRIYLLPRKFIQRTGLEHAELNTFEAVYNEINEFLQKMNVNEFKFRKVTKKYSFDKKDVPETATYYELRYSALYPAVNPDYSSPTVQAVFETSMSSLELFLIEKKVNGPCWLELKISDKESKQYSTDLFSWCEIEANCFKLEDISVTSYQNKSTICPSVVLAALYVQISVDCQLNKNEIINIVILLNHKFQLNKSLVKPSFDENYCLITRPQKVDWPNNASEKISKHKQNKVICCKDELELLEKFLEIFEHSNPDILVSYDSKFQLEVLVHKITTVKMKNWSRIGKLRCFQPPYFKNRIYLDQVFCGRPFCDIQMSIKELNLKVTNNDLVSLCSTILHKEINKCKTINPEDCPRYYDSAEKLESLIRSTTIKALYVLEIALELNVLQLAVQQTCIAGNTLSRTLATGVAERIEYLLLHAFHANNYIIPEKRKGKEDPNRNAAFSGGMILTPKKGFYDSLVLLMDFNSLYPSIIMEFNICFTTIPGAGYEELINFQLPDVNVHPGILPIEMKKLLDIRKQVKKLMQSTLSDDLKFQYNIRQLALKLIANSLIGCLGAPYTRFYSKGIASFISMKGREIFQNTVNMVESLGYKVIYGDTDSVMIETKMKNYEDAINLGKSIKQIVNRYYKKVELDIDEVFKYLLLLMKKQYAAISITQLADGNLKYKKEIKGLEIIKRNYCSLACNTGNLVLDQVLSEQPSEQRIKNIFEILRTARKNLQEGTSSLSSLEIVKQLSKDPSEYRSSQNSSHAIVAQRLNKSNARKWQSGDIISYVICKDGTDRNPGERAYHTTEIAANSALKIDADYYLSNQIYPVVSKICGPIQGISSQLIAESLGVHQSNPLNAQENSQPLPAQKHRFAECIPFEFYCRNENCKTLNQVKTVLVECPTGFQPSFAMCSNSTCDIPPFRYGHYIQNKLQLDIRKFITQYYRSEFKCDSQLCLKVCKSVALDSRSNFIRCQNCFDGNLHRMYMESDLFNQLYFFLRIFTLKDNHLESLHQKPSDDLLDFYNKTREFIMDEVDNSAYNIVDLTKVFKYSKDNTNYLKEYIDFMDEDNY